MGQTPQWECVDQARQSVPPCEIANAARAEYHQSDASSFALYSGCHLTLICHGPTFDPFHRCAPSVDSK